MTTTLQNYVSAPAILVGSPTYGSAIESPTSTAIGIQQSRATTIDLSMPMPQQWTLLLRLAAIRNTPEADRWPIADWPCEQAFADARSFIRRLPSCSILLPNIGVADDGEVNFLWESDGLHIDLGFYGTGAFSYFARSASGRKFYGDDSPASGGLPDEIANLIRS